jgi:hypothetical protein
MPLRAGLQSMAAECRKAERLPQREIVNRQLARELIALRAGRRRSLPVVDDVDEIGVSGPGDGAGGGGA